MERLTKQYLTIKVYSWSTASDIDKEIIDLVEQRCTTASTVVYA